MPPTIAYLSEGRLYYQAAGQPARLIESPFAQQAFERANRTRQRNDWKTKGAGAAFMSGGMLWGVDETDPAARRMHITGIAPGPQAGQLLYVLDMDHVSGLFLYDTASGEERRLAHRKEFQAQHLARHASTGVIACSIRAENGVANLAVMEADGGRLREVTEGDSLDQAPAWAPGEKETLVYQSAGIGRDAAGYPVALGPYAVQKLDLDRGELETLLEDRASDYLVPHVARDGALWYIRRPYHGAQSAATPLKMLGDAALLPFRLARAVFHYLNFFSMRYSGKPLTTAQGPKMDGPDLKQIMLWGRMIRAQQGLRRMPGEEPLALVPADWQLVRRAADGTETVAARGVLGFDLGTDGSVVYTTGSALFHLAAGGQPQRLGEGKLIEQVIAV